MSSPPAVELTNIWKRFPGVIANAGAELRVQPGTVHAVLGENGAGKTTLMNVLAGVYRPDEGTVLLDGVEHVFGSPADALDAGVAMVHQEFRLIPTFTVAENVALGSAPPVLRRREIEEQVADLAKRFGLQTDPRREVWHLSMGERQRVEILKALWRDATILILDEPTAVLTPAEANELGRIVAAMAADGRSIIFISHKLDEVTRFCDEATVLRGGATVAASLPVSSLDAPTLAELMVGESTLVSQRRVRNNPADPDQPVLSVRHMTVHDIHGIATVDDVSLEIGSGEIVGIAGVAGNGQRPLADAIAGLATPTQGSVRLEGDELGGAGPNVRTDAGLSYVPEDRIGVGLAPRLSVTENAMMRTYRTMGAGPMVDFGDARRHCEQLIDEFNVKTGGLDAPIAGLSGGNLQRLLVGRELATSPKALVAAQPTRGLDVQGVAAIQEVLVAQAEAGLGILLISEDLEELLALSDRILVMREGRIVAEFDAETATRAMVGEAMAGSASKREPA
ncbi:MAG: ABC transporter ATP-binding protein [Acidimicrobiales bacterium]|nr:ABC transporter ATP-binding protein [Acidimicrobiales bacterium]